jgi:WD40 repeat protein
MGHMLLARYTWHPCHLLWHAPRERRAAQHAVIGWLPCLACQVVKQLRVDAYVRSVAWDPEDKYLAALQADGSLLIWEATNWDKQPRRKRVGPKVQRPPSAATSLRCTTVPVRWSLPLPLVQTPCCYPLASGLPAPWKPHARSLAIPSSQRSTTHLHLACISSPAPRPCTCTPAL